MENLKKHLKEFCEETSLNGWFFVAKDGLSWTRKWDIVFEGNQRQMCYIQSFLDSGHLGSYPWSNLLQYYLHHGVPQHNHTDLR